MAAPPGGQILESSINQGYPLKGRTFVIGTSLGGADALCALLGKLPGDFPAPILVTQHTGSQSLGLLPQILGQAGLRHVQSITAAR